MTDEQQLIVDGLRNLHLPPAITGWPSAPGWWVLCALLFVLIGCAVGWFVRHRQQRDPRQQAATALRAAFAHWKEEGDHTLYLQQSHHVLRQLAITLAGRSHVSRLCGDQWVDWLEQQVDQRLPAVARNALANGAYQREGIGTDLIEHVHTAYLQWVNTVRESTCANSDNGRQLIELPSIKCKTDPFRSVDKSSINQETHA